MEMEILVVDDDRGLLRSLEIVLTQNGHHVRTHTRVREALQDLQEGHRTDVLLLDYRIGTATADEFLIHAQDLVRHGCLTLLMTGHIEQIDRQQLRCLGVDDLLAKPLDLGKLIALVGTRAKTQGNANRFPC